MKIYDCFMFFDEEMLLDLRLNIMDKYVDKFVITEASYMHSGKAKKLIFDINKFSKFKDKIIYNVLEKQPTNLEVIDNNDINNIKWIENALWRELSLVLGSEKEKIRVSLFNDIEYLKAAEIILDANQYNKIISP